MSDFFAMGGYAGYVWPAYVISFVVVSGLTYAIYARGRALKKRLSEFDRADDKDEAE